jgi:hypothetical protein
MSNPRQNARSPSTNVAKPKNCETGTFPCRTADANQGASGLFMVGADVPDEGRVAGAGEIVPPSHPDVLVRTPVGKFRHRSQSEC